MRCAAALVLALLVAAPPPASSQDEPPLALAREFDTRSLTLLFSASAAADFASTRYALAHGAREMNPVVRTTGGMAALKLAAIPLEVIATRSFARSHPGWARAVKWAIVGVQLGAAAINLRNAGRSSLPGG